MEKVIRNFKNNKMELILLENRLELVEYLDGILEPGQSVGCGDSVSLEELGVFDYLRRSDIEFLDKYKEGLTSKEKREIYIKNFSANTFITGSNAITEDGKIVNIDGNGSRIAPIIYGPEKVLIIVGKNKITRDEDEARQRVRQIAAPKDAKRLGKNTPCAKLGYCIDCKHEERICNSFVTIANQFDKDRIKILLLNESLGY